MSRLVLGAVGLVLLALAVLFPAWWYDADGSLERVDDPTRITSYSATFDVDEDGSMEVVETIVLAVSTGDRHGIVRYVDRADENAWQRRRDPLDVTVSVDDESVPVRRTTEDRGRYAVLRIGDPDRALEVGEHTYRISYTIEDVLIEDEDGEGSRFSWDLLPGGWSQPIDQARLSVILPAEASDVQCAVGNGVPGGCRASGEGTTLVSVALGMLPPYTPVTVFADVAQPVPPTLGESRPWSQRFDPVLAPLPLVGLVLLAGLAAGAVAAGAARRAYDPKPRFGLPHVPPPGIGPAQAAYLLEERVEREQYVATVLHAAESGVVSLERSDSGWTMRPGEAAWGTVDDVTRGLESLVGSRGFTAAADDVQAGKRLAADLATFESRTAAWARRQGYVVSGPLGGLGGILVLVAFGLALGLALWNPLDFSLLAIVPGLFAVGGISLLAPGAATRRTASGRDLWSRAGGFERVLATPASKERFDFSGREELYAAHVPWAVAFGCADAWAAKFRTETGREPPLPAYLGAGYAGDQTGAWSDRMVGDLSSTLSSAISAYQATQSPSGS